MFEKFTDRARKTMALANQEASKYNNDYIDSTHVMLGLLKEGCGVACNILKNRNIELNKVRLEVEKLINLGEDMVVMGKLPQTPESKRVIQSAVEHARNLNHKHVGTEHMLLGLSEDHKIGPLLYAFGLDTDTIREAIKKLYLTDVHMATFGTDNCTPEQMSDAIKQIMNEMRTSLQKASDNCKQIADTLSVLIQIMKEENKKHF